MDDRVGTATYVGEMKAVKVNKKTALKSAEVQFLQEVRQGLRLKQKTLPCKYFYDQKGSELFEEICELEEYYITRVELALLESIKTELAEKIGRDAIIIEPGAGAGIKIRTLLNALDSPQSYVPMDISKDFLFYSADVIQRKFPKIKIMPIQGDFTQPVKWLEKEDHNNRVVFFPGSTIGNFEKADAVSFLKNMHDLIGQNGALIIGADLLKDQQILEAAYDDHKGVTARFNKNLLTRINNQLGGDFKPNRFSHKAHLNHKEQRIEMHLISKTAQKVTIGGEQFLFEAGETIHTENSHKYSIESFLAIAEDAGFRSLKTWTDDAKMFSVHYLVHQ